jgi:hypothetical protein
MGKQWKEVTLATDDSTHKSRKRERRSKSGPVTIDETHRSQRSIILDKFTKVESGKQQMIVEMMSRERVTLSTH